MRGNVGKGRVFTKLVKRTVATLFAACVKEAREKRTSNMGKPRCAYPCHVSPPLKGVDKSG